MKNLTKNRSSIYTRATKLSLNMAAILTINASCLFASGIPVVDGAQINQNQINHIQDTIQQAKAWVEEANRWVNTTVHYKAQLDAYAHQLASQTGIRDVASFLKDVKELYGSVNKLGVTITDAIDMTKNIKGFNKAEFINKFMNLIDTHYEYNPCKDIAENEKTKRNSCMITYAEPIQDMQVYQEASKNMDKNIKNLNRLSKKLENTRDIKESMDIGNQIQAQIALMTAQKIQFETYQDTQRLKQEQAKLQEKALFLKSQSNWEYR